MINGGWKDAWETHVTVAAQHCTLLREVITYIP
jgi:hypothetical protein